MPSTNYGVCNECRKRVPARHVIRDDLVFLVKDCPECGTTEALVSSDAATWQRKRVLCRFDPDAPITCTLQCEKCARQHHPTMVFVDVTNRCNMNCPICIANIPGMGFEFHPPMPYFQKVFEALGRMEPRPLVQLFGGEPTMRDDLFEIIDLAQSHGLRVRIVTNGLKLADEEYCKRICEAKVHVLLAFDGRDPKIYERLRKNPGAYEKKLKALENLSRFSRHKSTIMCCVARHVNDEHIGDLIDLCHENRHFIKCLHFIPLTETWEEGEFETDVATTLEDVEQIVDAAMPEAQVEFVPAGLTEYLRTASRFLGVLRLKFGGVHPNCESLTYVVSDGERYRPLGYYLRRPMQELADELVSRCEAFEPKLAKLEPDRWFQRLRGRMIILAALGGLLVSAVDSRKLVKGNRLLALPAMGLGFLLGRKPKDVARKHLTVQDGMLMVVLPFEEYHSVESARLQDCFAGFAYEDPDTGEVKTMPVCVWGLYKNAIQGRLAENYRAATAGRT